MQVLRTPEARFAGLADRSFLTAFGDSDPVTRDGFAGFQARAPGAKDQPHETPKGGHFIQEDAPDEIVALIEGLFRRSPSR